MQFILDQQAKFFAGMEDMREKMEESRQLHDKLEKQVSEFAEQQAKINMSLGKAMLGLTEHIEKLTAAQATTEEQLKSLAATQAAAQAATDERLNALINVADDLVRRTPRS